MALVQTGLYRAAGNSPTTALVPLKAAWTRIPARRTLQEVGATTTGKKEGKRMATRANAAPNNRWESRFITASFAEGAYSSTSATNSVIFDRASARACAPCAVAR